MLHESVVSGPESCQWWLALAWTQSRERLRDSRRTVERKSLPSSQYPPSDHDRDRHDEHHRHELASVLPVSQAATHSLIDDRIASLSVSANSLGHCYKRVHRLNG